MRLAIVFLFLFGIIGVQSCSNDKNLEDRESIDDIQSNISLASRSSSIEDIEMVFKEEVRYGATQRVTYQSRDYFYEEVLNSSGAVIGYIDENEGKYGVSDLRLSNIHRYVDLINNQEYIFDLNYSDTYATVIPDFELFTNDQVNSMILSGGNNRCMGNFLLCSTVATLASIAIAASDGPLPFMDVLAVSTYISANALCVSNYDLCINPPK
jgi:hypothetical protein